MCTRVQLPADSMSKREVYNCYRYVFQADNFEYIAFIRCKAFEYQECVQLCIHFDLVLRPVASSAVYAEYYIYDLFPHRLALHLQANLPTQSKVVLRYLVYIVISSIKNA